MVLERAEQQSEAARWHSYSRRHRRRTAWLPNLDVVWERCTKTVTDRRRLELIGVQLEGKRVEAGGFLRPGAIGHPQFTVPA